MERWNVTWNLPHEKPRRMPCPLGSLTDGRPRDGSAVPDMHLLTPGFLFLLGTGCQQRAESHRLRPACFTTSAAADKRALHRQTRRHNGGSRSHPPGRLDISLVLERELTIRLHKPGSRVCHPTLPLCAHGTFLDLPCQVAFPLRPVLNLGSLIDLHISWSSGVWRVP